MRCFGCGNKSAVVTRSGYSGGERWEVCDAGNCGNLKAPFVPDVYFRQPYHDENLADEGHPHGRLVESRRHKAALLRGQNLREDGDPVHGSSFRDAKAPKRAIPAAFRKRLRETVKESMLKMNRKGGGLLRRGK